MTESFKQARRVVFNDGSVSEIAVSFKAENAEQVKVYVGNPEVVHFLMTRGVHYTLDGVGEDSFTVNISDPHAWADYDRYAVYVDYAIEQDVDVDAGGQLGKRFEDAVDRLTVIMQSLNDKVGRSIKVPLTTAVGENFEVRVGANRLIGWDETGTVLETKPDPSDLLLDAVDAAERAENARDIAENFASDIVSQGNVPIYATVTGMAALPVPAGINAIRVNGYYTVGDGGGALYSKVVSQPTHAGKFQTADGAWWELTARRPNILMFGARAGSATYAAANVVAINGALAYKSAKGGGRVYGGFGTFYVNSSISFQGLTGVYLDGLGRRMTIKLAAPFTGNEIVTMRGTLNLVLGCVLDCSAIATASTWLSGVRAENENTTDCGITGCEIKDASFCGIWMNDSNGAYKHTRFVAEDNIVTNVGWMGISVIGTVNGRVKRNEVTRTGFTAIWADERNAGLQILSNYVSKATPPYRIYNGPGSVGGVEKGFMIGYAPSNRDTVIAFNRCIDNRNAAEDGIGLGEDGTEHGDCIIAYNIVRYAGLFGIDVASRATVMGNRIDEPAQSGIFMSLDLGGSIAQAIVKANTIRNCNGPYAFQISQNMGNPLTIADCEIADNTVVDYRTPAITQYGFRIRRTNLTITNLSLHDNVAVNVGTAGFINDDTGTDWPIYVKNNRWKNHEKAVVGNFSTTGYEAFTISNPAAIDLTLMTGGYHGKEIDVYFNNGNTTLKPDWLNTTGGGDNRIIGLGNVPRLMAAGDSARLRYRGGFGWQVLSITDAY